MSKLGKALAVVAAIYLLLTLVDRFVLLQAFFQRNAIPLALAAVEATAITGCGWWLHRGRFHAARDFLLGYPVFGALCFLVGTLKIAVWTMLPLLALGLIGALLAYRRTEAQPPADLAPVLDPAAPRPHPGSPGVQFIAIGAVAVVFAAAVVVAQAPPVSLDELAYHLAVPHTWVLEGRAVELPLLSHSYFPLGIESADLPLFVALGIDGGIASHWLHLLAAIATALVIAGEVRKRAPEPLRSLVTAAIITTPALAIAAGWSLVDFPLAGLCVILIAAVESDDDRVVAGATAAGLLTKYTFVPVLLIALIVSRKWRAALPGLAAGATFYLRNVLLTGNPVAPFLSRVAPHIGRYRTLYISTAVFDGSFIDEALGASLLMLAFLIRGRMAVVFVLAAVVLLFGVSPSTRLLLPFLIIPAITSASGLLASSTGVRRTLTACLLAAIVMQTLLVVFQVDRAQSFKLLTSPISDQQYVAEQRPATAAVQWLDSQLPPDSRTLVVGLNETYWFTHRVRGGGNFDGPRVSAYLTTPTPESLRAKLAHDGITHVAVISAPPPTAEAKKVEERRTELSPEAQRALAQMLDRYAGSINSRGNATLFALR